MNNNNSNKIFLIIGAVAAIVMVWLFLDNEDKKQIIADLERKNDEKDDINRKLQEKIEESEEIPAEVKNQLEGLIEKYNNIDNNVSQELMTASSLIEIKEYSKAIGVLTKIIENLLKEKYSNDLKFKEKMKKKSFPVLKDYLDYAKEDCFLSAEEFHFANGLREIRNEDAHQLNIKKSKLLTSSAFLSAVDLIIKMSKKIAGIKKTILIEATNGL